MKNCRRRLLVLLVGLSAGAAGAVCGDRIHAVGAELASARPDESGHYERAAEPTWYHSPGLSIMTGFIYEPLSPYTIDAWKETLGNQFDADRWAKDFKEAGADHVVFYDKWIDGLVFHDTKTTDFKTKRDFVRELAAACQRGGLRLVFYFNAISDGNPEFDQWALLDKQGKPIVFSPNWPTRYQTLHSPFRRKAVEQVRELLSNYGPVDGIWHDIFHERTGTSSTWVREGYERMYGEKFEDASPARLAEFNARTLAGYLDEVEAIRRDQHQENCIYTANGSGSNFLAGGVWTRWVGSRLHYLFNEGHSFARNDQLARMAWVLPKPLEINFLLSDTWFTPLEDKPPPPRWTEKQAIAATAIAVCQGASVNFALTPGHSGVFDEALGQAKAAGAWFRRVQPYLDKARPYADVAIVLGTPSADGPGLPAANSLWRAPQVKSQGAWDQAVGLSDALAHAGIFSQFLYETQQGGNWPASLAGFRAVLVPELAVLNQPRAEQIRHYVEKGGRLVAFGHASLLDASGTQQNDYALGDVFGARYRGEIAFPPQMLKVQVKADSEHSAQFAAEHLVDGLATAWASSGTPMPHWAQITLPESAQVGVVELVSRQGPYLVTDIDIEARQEGGWKPVKSIRGATARAISAKLDRPVETQAIRVTILRELYRGEDRQYADVESIRVLGTDGRDLSTHRAANLPLVAMTDGLRRLFRTSPVSFLPMAVAVDPTTAQVVARLDREDGPPGMLRNDFGNGEAVLITTSEATFQGRDEIFSPLVPTTVGKPTLSCSDEAKKRYRFILTCVDGGHVLHVIDPVVEGAAFQAREVEISLATDRFGKLPPQEARLVGGAKALPSRNEGGRMTFVVRPDPVANILLQ